MMDTSESYVKMCEKAKEMQVSRIKMEKGSIFYAYELVNIHKLDGTVEQQKQEYLLYYELSGFHYGPHYHSGFHPGNFWQINEEDITTYFKREPIWLPRQDQLQGMVDGNSFEKIAPFNGWLIDQFSKKEIEWFSMEQLWLAFVMKEKYDKIWDGENWVKSF